MLIKKIDRNVTPLFPTALRLMSVALFMSIGLVLLAHSVFAQSSISAGGPACLPKQPQPACNGLGTKDDCVRLFRIEIDQPTEEANEFTPLEPIVGVDQNTYYGKAARDTLLTNKKATFSNAGVSAGEDEAELFVARLDHKNGATYTKTLFLKLFPNVVDAIGGELENFIISTKDGEDLSSRRPPRYPWGWDKRISAIEVGKNMRLTIWDEIDYQGKSLIILGPQTYNSLSAIGWKDRIQSFKVCAYRTSDETNHGSNGNVISSDKKTPASQPNAPNQPKFIKLYVGNLSADTTEETLRSAFAEFGEVKSVKMGKDGDDNPIGFVEMAAGAADEAIEQLNESELDGNEIVVRKAKPDEGN